MSGTRTKDKNSVRNRIFYTHLNTHTHIQAQRFLMIIFVLLNVILLFPLINLPTLTITYWLRKACGSLLLGRKEHTGTCVSLCCLTVDVSVNLFCCSVDRRKVNSFLSDCPFCSFPLLNAQQKFPIWALKSQNASRVVGKGRAVWLLWLEKSLEVKVCTWETWCVLEWHDQVELVWANKKNKTTHCVYVQRI